MKKLFAILIVALLATSMSFAQPGVYNNGQSWQSNAETGEFQAEIMCIPAFSMPLTGGLLGNFFNSVGTHSIPSPSVSESRGSSNAAPLGGLLKTGRERTSP